MSDKSIYRKKEPIASPDKLNQYIRVPGVSSWVIILGIVILLFGLVGWGLFAKITTTVECTGIPAGDTLVSYVSMEDIEQIKSGMKIKLGQTSGTIQDIATVPNSKKEVEQKISNDYYISKLHLSEWNYQITIACDEPIQELQSFQIVTGKVRPIDLLMKQ